MKKFHDQPIGDDMLEEFDGYILNGGFPKSLEFQDIDARRAYTRGIVSEIFEKDVKTRNRISNIALYERVQFSIINNYSAPFSIGNLVERLRAEKIGAKPQTVRDYIRNFRKAKIVYGCKRFDLKNKLECDFIARKPDGSYAYIQVAYSLQAGDAASTEKLQERERRPSRSIRDGCLRYIISLDRNRDQREGVHHIDAAELFLDKEAI